MSFPGYWEVFETTVIMLFISCNSATQKPRRWANQNDPGQTRTAYRHKRRRCQASAHHRTDGSRFVDLGKGNLCEWNSGILRYGPDAGSLLWGANSTSKCNTSQTSWCRAFPIQCKTQDSVIKGFALNLKCPRLAKSLRFQCFRCCTSKLNSSGYSPL